MTTDPRSEAGITPALPDSAPARASLRDRVIHATARTLLGVLRALPVSLAVRVAQGLGSACGRAVPRWSKVAECNLQQALPELSPQERKEVIRGVFRNLGRVAFALAKLPCWSPEEVRKHVDFVGLQYFREAASRGRGVMLLTAHLGNWELGALAHGAIEGPLHVMVRPIDNQLVDKLVERLRQAHGNRVIRKRNAAREVLRVLKANGTVGILADQNAVRDEAVFVDFFGIKAATNKGFAQLALRSGASVVPAVAWWDAAAMRHVVEYGPTIELIDTGNPSSDLQSNTQRLQDALEERVRRHPDQWLWIHRRWKTRPPGKVPSARPD